MNCSTRKRARGGPGPRKVFVVALSAAFLSHVARSQAIDLDSTNTESTAKKSASTETTATEVLVAKSTVTVSVATDPAVTPAVTITLGGLSLESSLFPDPTSSLSEQTTVDTADKNVDDEDPEGDDKPQEEDKPDAEETPKPSGKPKPKPKPKPRGATPDGLPAPGPLSSPASKPSKRESTMEDWAGRIPLVVRNLCEATMWPGVATQHGEGPGIGGFELAPKEKRDLFVSSDWQGRVWGRTNCTVSGDSCSCQTGDCFSKLDCEFSGSTPATLAEFNLAGGTDGNQNFYDISLVDGYNLPMGIKYIPSNKTRYIPPNLTNCACVATPGWLGRSASTGFFNSNSSFPVPLEARETNDSVRNWCPWPYLAFPPTKPGDGVYPYPDDKVRRPDFSPCNSACAATGDDKECCVGKYHDPDLCKPSDYSRASKAICPDAYSFAFDDRASTFAIPQGGGWEVVLCPKGRSTNILRQLSAEIDEINHSGLLSEVSIMRLMNATYVTSDRGTAANSRPMGASVVVAILLAMVLIAF